LEKVNKSKSAFSFELVYWAHYLYPIPLKPRIKDKENPFYVEDPYLRASSNSVEAKPGAFRQKLAAYVSEQLDKIFLNDDRTINYESIVDFVIHHFFRDLEMYYNDYCVIQSKTDCHAKTAICSELADTLNKHRNRRIMLIAHSMGSIIAYDVLTRDASDVPIDTFVTIGSPLGLPFIKSKIFAARKQEPSQKGMLRTPENIRSRWNNLADLRDKIAINHVLRDDFKENARQVGPVDKIVTNDYAFGDQKNPHKSYGYVRTPELAEIISEFLFDTP
jgi:hypothetical protein